MVFGSIIKLSLLNKKLNVQTKEQKQGKRKFLKTKEKEKNIDLITVTIINVTICLRIYKGYEN